MNHLDVVAGTLVTDPLAAGLAVRLGGDGLEDVLDVGPGLLVTTGHDGGAVAGTLLTTGDTGTDVADALGLEVLGAAVGVGEVGVATINDDVTRLKAVLEEELDEVVDGLAGHDEEHHAPGLLELGDELLDAVRANDALALGLVLEEAVDLGDGAVEGNDVEAVVSGVEDQVLAHDRKANETEVSTAKGEWLAAVQLWVCTDVPPSGSVCHRPFEFCSDVCLSPCWTTDALNQRHEDVSTMSMALKMANSSFMRGEGGKAVEDFSQGVTPDDGGAVMGRMEGCGGGGKKDLHRFGRHGLGCVMRDVVVEGVKSTGGRGEVDGIWVTWTVGGKFGWEHGRSDDGGGRDRRPTSSPDGLAASASFAAAGRSGKQLVNRQGDSSDAARSPKCSGKMEGWMDGWIDG